MRGQICNLFITICCYSLVQVPQNSGPHLTVSFETPRTGRARSLYLYFQEQGRPVIPPDTGFSFCRLLQLAGLWWKYSNPSMHGVSLCPKSKSCYDRQSVCLGVESTLEVVTRYYFCLEVAVLSLWGALYNEIEEVEVILRTTVSRPVRLGVLPLLEQVTRYYIYLSDNYFLYFSCRAPPSDERMGP
jgi:hypothetical protein